MRAGFDALTNTTNLHAMGDIKLSEESELQVQSLLHFSKFKRDQHVREIASVLQDFKDDNVSDGEVYSTQEVRQMLSKLKQQVEEYVDKEVMHAYHTNALLVKMLLAQGQQHGLNLYVDTNQLENEKLLQQIAQSEATALRRPAADFMRRGNQLDKLGVSVASVPVQDPKLLAQREELQADLESALQRVRDVQQQTTAMMREKTQVAEQLDSVSAKLASREAELQALTAAHEATVKQLESEREAKAASKSEETSSGSGQLWQQLESRTAELKLCQADLNSLRAQLVKKEAEIKQADAALAGKIQDSKQWVQMRKLMQVKSQDVVLLRKKLSKYEPQDVPEDGDTIGTAVHDDEFAR